MKRPLMAALLLAMSCASRQVPRAFPTGAAANADTPAAPVAPVGAVVRDEPPLPGEATTDWPALEDSHAP